MEAITLDVTNSRDVIKRVEELEANLEQARIDGDDTTDMEVEFAALEAFVSEASYADDWHYGERIIADDYFVQYAEGLARDIGAVSTEDSGWPNRHIDWEAAAEDLQQDYFDVEFDGKRYWLR